MLVTTLQAVVRCEQAVRKELSTQVFAEPVRTRRLTRLSQLDKIIADEVHLTTDETGTVTAVTECAKNDKGAFRLGSATDPEATYRIHGEKKSDLGYNVNVTVNEHVIIHLRVHYNHCTCLQGEHMPSHPIHVILADDHAVVRKGIREFLLEPGDIDVVAEAADGDEALALIEQLQPDVAVLDIQMPKRSGIDVCRTIRARHWPVGILILTAYDDDPYVLAVLQAGANGYVLKTANADEIIRAVRDVYEGKSALDPIIARKLMTQLAGQSEVRPLESLTTRETDVLKLAARGYTNKAIGAQLNISDRTVQGHLANIFAKLHVTTRTESVMRAVSLGWIPPVLDNRDEVE